MAPKPSNDMPQPLFDTDLGDDCPRFYSLMRMFLDHGTRLDESGPHYFVVNIKDLSPLPVEVQDERIKFLLDLFPLDDDQKRAFDMSTTDIKYGVNMILGPPGTGKTRTLMVIALVLAALHIPVMLAARSTGAIDGLSAEVAKALAKHERLRDWVGYFYRYRAFSIQCLDIRHSFTDSFPDDSMTPITSVILRRHGIVKNVLELARENSDDSDCSDLLQLVKTMEEAGLNDREYRRLKNLYLDLSVSLLRSATIVATTLDNASCEILRNEFQPTFLLCDDAGQCTEGELSSALTYPSLRAVVFAGQR